ncbi:Smr/MutS family protein [Vulgatibacter incomptus]|uniref:Smr domain protein n=1 Tax=Vulgatibacter incomptus TaxID=1391653 RepID=A0A0K1PF77_9BACT|nr:Smr/MutS family protein [Vulgatibacter incomptus]AKU92162.1 Smr domain protein [Vulgatibacter incomptus]
MAKARPFNNPFGDLVLRDEPVKEAPKELPALAPERPAPASARPENVADETELFFAFVGDVEPVRRGPPTTAPAPPPPEFAQRIADEDAEALAELCELVAGTAPFDLASSDEYIEGSVASLDRRVVRRLRAGDYAVQGHLDLHGLTRPEAKEALGLFVEESRRKGRRCVVVIHGRGLHSKDQIPVLKEGVQVWLSQGRIGSNVLAFATARQHDGGAGAVYVLLRR